MDPWNVALVIAAVLAAVVALRRLHRWLLRLEQRGYIYYWHKKPQGGALSSLSVLQEAVDPAHRHMVEARSCVNVKPPRRGPGDDDGAAVEPPRRSAGEQGPPA